MTNALTDSIDVAQVVLYVFWAFFLGLILWLRKEDRREGYPLESDNPQRVRLPGAILMPRPKTFLLRNGGSLQVPNYERDTREIRAERTSSAAGAALQPIGDPMTSNVGPASYAERVDEPEVNREGDHLIVPMRIATAFAVSAGADPRGWDVVAADGVVAGKVKELWVDRADIMVRYLEVELATDEATAAGTRLLPIQMLRILGEQGVVRVSAIRSDHFVSVPTLKAPDSVTLLEEDKICAFYAGGRLYAEPSRLGPIV